MLIYISGIAILLAGAYVILLFGYLKSWHAIPPWDTSPGTEDPHTSISVIVPARNEESHIAACLQSILANIYPPDQLEVIVVDDDSTDRTAEIVATFENVRMIRATAESKKNALETGIQSARGTLIVTTDADCTVGKNWLSTIASYYEFTEPRMISGPVIYQNESSLFERFQSMDYMGLLGVGAAGIHARRHFIAAGANLAFEKSTFMDLGGYAGSRHLASGDDMFLIEKFAEKYPDQIAFLKSRDAVVHTQAIRTIPEFIQQRIRWGTKNKNYKSLKIYQIWAALWLYYVMILGALIAGIFNAHYWWAALILFGAKMISDYVFLSALTTFFRKREILRSFLPAFFIEWIYVVVIGILVNTTKKYRWKSRETS